MTTAPWAKLTPFPPLQTHAMENCCSAEEDLAPHTPSDSQGDHQELTLSQQAFNLSCRVTMLEEGVPGRAFAAHRPCAAVRGWAALPAWYYPYPSPKTQSHLLAEQPIPATHRCFFVLGWASALCSTSLTWLYSKDELVSLAGGNKETFILPCATDTRKIPKILIFPFYFQHVEKSRYCSTNLEL